jgi:serine/threonine-protein kinase RsbT
MTATAMELLRERYEIQGRNFDKAGEVSGEIKVLLRDLGIEASRLRRLVIVAFEAEMNVVMYASRGMMTLIVTDDDITLETTDDGPGIPDIELALQEGYSTASDEMREMGFGFGMGLPNMKKNSDEFRIESEVGKGTSVYTKIRLAAGE